MAKSGYLAKSMGSYYLFYVYWEVISQDIENNISKVYLSWGTRKKSANSQTYNADARLWASVGSTTLKSNASVNWDMRSNSVGAERSMYNTTITVSHNDDGSKSLYVYGYLGVGSLTNASSAEISGYIDLPDIPRATKPVLSVSSADMGTEITIDLSGAAVSTFTHDLSYELPDGTAGAIASGLGLVSQAWSVPDFATQIPSATSGTVKIICTTYDAEGSEIGTQTVTLTGTVPEDVIPVVSAVSVTEAVSGLAERFGAFIQSKSRLAVAITAAGAKGSTVASVSSTFEGGTFAGASWTSDYVTGSGELSIVTTVKDSRGRTAKATTLVQVLAYIKPQIPTFEAWRVDDAGEVDDSGDYIAIRYAYSVPALNGGNTVSMTIDAKHATETDYDTELVSGSALAEDTTVYPTILVSSDYRWDIRITVQDYFSAASQADADVWSADVIMDFRADGTAVAFHKTSEREGVDEFANPVSFMKRVEMLTPLGVPDGGTGVKTVEELKAVLELVSYVAQDLTDAQKAQARENIGAASRGVVLWENASPTSVFASQYVTLADECVNCNRFEFYFNTDLNNGYGQAMCTLHLDEGATYVYTNASYVYYDYSNSSWKSMTRFIDVTMNDKAALLGNGYYNGTNYNSTMVPLKIIGYKV